MPASELAAARAEIAKLQHVLGKKILENKILNEAVEIAAAKNAWSASHLKGYFLKTNVVRTNISGLLRMGCGCSQDKVRSAPTILNSWTGFEHLY